MRGAWNGRAPPQAATDRERFVPSLLAHGGRLGVGGLHALPCRSPAPVAVDIPIALKMCSCYVSAPHIKSWFFHELILRHNQPTAAPMAKVTPRSTISGLDRDKEPIDDCGLGGHTTSSELVSGDLCHLWDFFDAIDANLTAR